MADGLSVHLKVFISSPSDVADERYLARQVLINLEKEHAFRGKVEILEVSWDDPGAPVALAAHLTPQEAINRERPKPSECDIVLVILWSRMGTPLPVEYRKPDGSVYRSGTEWEFLDGLEAARRHGGKSLVWVYRRTEKVSLDADDPELPKKLAQRQAVKDFFAEFEGEGGALKGSYHPYGTPSEFSQLLERQLREHISKRLEALPVKLLAVETAPAPGEAELEAAAKPLWPSNPYRGLDPFGPNHTAIFFGRGLETDELLKRVRDGVRVLAVIGASGSGKSSLVAAGLLPRLAGGAVAGSDQWVQVRFTPAEEAEDEGGANPFFALALKLFPWLPADKYTVTGLAGDLAGSPDIIETLAGEILAGGSEFGQLLLFADQFEELFTARVAARYREPFVRLVEAVAASRRLRLVLTLRADYYQHCTIHPSLAAHLRAGSFPLAAPSGRALTEIIEAPARAAGVEFEPGLVDDILNEAGAEAGRLALVEFTLEQLFDKSLPANGSSGRPPRLSRRYYRDELKGIGGAIAIRAEQAVRDAMGKVDEAALFRVFDALSEVGERGSAVRKWVYKDRLPVVAQTLVEKLVQARILISGSDYGETQVRAWVEVAHEAVLREWPRFRNWLEQYGEFKLWRRGLNQAREAWDQSGRKSAELLSGPRLKEALAKQKQQPQWLDAEEYGYIRGSRNHQWLIRGVFAGMATGLLLALSQYFTWIKEEEISHKVAFGVFLARLGYVAEPEMVRIPPDRDCSPQSLCGFPAEALPYKPGESIFRRRQARIDKSFYIGRYEVSFEDYDVFRLSIQAEGGCGEGEERKIPNPHGQDHGWGKGGRPVIKVNWYIAECFADWLVRKTGKPYRLPTKDEWLFANRSDSPTNFFWGKDYRRADDYAWHALNDGFQTHPVGQKKPNAWGLFDTAGNVDEWTVTCFVSVINKDGYVIEVAGDENAPSSGLEQTCERRVTCGGGWSAGPGDFQSNHCGWSKSDYADDSRGFRLARDL